MEVNIVENLQPGQDIGMCRRKILDSGQVPSRPRRVLRLRDDPGPRDGHRCARQPQKDELSVHSLLPGVRAGIIGVRAQEDEHGHHYWS